MREAQDALSALEQRWGRRATYEAATPPPASPPAGSRREPAQPRTEEAEEELDEAVDTEEAAARLAAEVRERAAAERFARDAARRAKMSPEELMADDKARMAREAAETRQARKRAAREQREERRQLELSEREEEIWGDVADVLAKVEADPEVELSDAEYARLDEAQARDQALKNQEAAGAVADLGKSLFGAFMDIGLSAVNAAVGQDESNVLQDGLRSRAKQSEQRERLAAYEAELRALGVTLDDAAAMDEPALRKTYRVRVRTLHPDLNLGGGKGQGQGAGELPSIYELNEAYEVVKRALL